MLGPQRLIRGNGTPIGKSEACSGSIGKIPGIWFLVRKYIEAVHISYNDWLLRAFSLYD